MGTGADPVRGYLLDLVTQERLELQFNPEELSLKHGADWSSKSPRGSSHPRRHFAHGKGRSFTLTLRFLRTRSDAEDVDKRRRQLEALPFPDYDASGRMTGGPHPVRVGLGAWRTLRCLVEEVDLDFGPWFHPETLLPGELVAKVTFCEVPEGGDLSHDDVRGGR